MKKTKTFLYTLLMIIALCSIFLILSPTKKENKETSGSNLVTTEPKKSISATPTLVPTTSAPSSNSLSVEEKDIYSFSQGPKALKQFRPWAGTWANLVLDGNAFGNFGCGFCCMANIYSSLSSKKCSPVDIYQYAKEVSSYAPSPGIGAIGWSAINETLKQCGFTSQLHMKPSDYATFQEHVGNAYATIVLVSSRNCDEYWEDTPGHYVVIWRYNEQDDTVFLTESGDPDKNRTTIPLKTVYNALKTESLSQYLSVNDYDEAMNNWNWNQISEAWITP